jgi:hypothetical protein
MASGAFACGSPLARAISKLSIRVETPLFWRKGGTTPPLVTTAADGTDADLAGELGQPTTSVLRGGVYDNQANLGFRISLSSWFDDCRERGLLFRYWTAGVIEESSNFDSNQFPILARPFFNTTTNPFENDTQLIAFTGDSEGRIGVQSRSEVYGLDIVLRKMAYADRFSRVDWLYGYQHTFMSEALLISSQTNVVGNVPPIQGSSITVVDGFETANSFHGFNAGLMATRRVTCFQFEAMLRLAIGNLNRRVITSGTSSTTSGGTTTTSNQGLLVRDTNRVDLTDDTFVISPEVGVNMAYALTPTIDFSIGYNYLMVPKMVQAGRQIPGDLRVNLSDPLTGSLDPSFRLTTSRYWIRSLGLGAQFRY